VAPLLTRIPVAAPVTPTVVISGAALLAAPARTAVIRTTVLARVLAASLGMGTAAPRPLFLPRLIALHVIYINAWLIS
jgi:hypothetical protein